MGTRDSTEARQAREGFRAGLRLIRGNPDFRRLYIALLISYGGDWFLMVALFGLAHELTGSPVALALVVAVQELPFVVASPIGGVLADRLDRRKLMVVSDLARAALCLVFLLVDERGDLWFAFGALAILSGFSAVFDPASAAAVPNLVEPEELGPANSLVGSAWGTMLAIGAAIGGVVVATAGADTAFLVDAVSFAVSALLLWRISRSFSGERREEHPGPVEAIRETARYARRDHRVMALLAVKGVFGLAAGGVLVLISIFALDVFEAGDMGVGILMSARGLGAFVGPFLGRMAAGHDDRNLFSAIGIALVVFGLAYTIFGLAPSMLVAAPIVLCAHMGGGAQWTLSTYGLQKISPDSIRGRVFAFDFALITISISVSAFAIGWAADRWDPRPVAIAVGVVALVSALAWWATTGKARRSGLG